MRKCDVVAPVWGAMPEAPAFTAPLAVAGGDFRALYGALTDIEKRNEALFYVGKAGYPAYSKLLMAWNRHQLRYSPSNGEYRFTDSVGSQDSLHQTVEGNSIRVGYCPSGSSINAMLPGCPAFWQDITGIRVNRIPSYSWEGAEGEFFALCAQAEKAGREAYPICHVHAGSVDMDVIKPCPNRLQAERARNIVGVTRDAQVWATTKAHVIGHTLHDEGTLIVQCPDGTLVVMVEWAF